MASFVIEGGHKLHGEIVPQGAKNEVLEVICATLLTDEEVIISNIPNILDVNNLIQLLRDMGVKVEKKDVDTYAFRADAINFDYLESDEFLTRCSRLRGSAGSPLRTCHDSQARRRQNRAAQAGHALLRHPKIRRYVPIR